MTGKTTIAISLESRKKLEDYKSKLEKERGHFIDMDEVIDYLLNPEFDNLPHKGG